MATKFLDYTGLSYLWNKIKEWVQNKLKYYPYICEPVDSYGYKHWSYNNIADDTTVGFDGFNVTGRYHIRFSSNTHNAPVSPSAYTDGILIVDTINTALYVSSHYRIIQTFILSGYQNRPIIYRRLGATSSDENAVNGLIFNSWHCDSGEILDVNTTGNAATATKLATARTINVQDSSATNTGTAASFDGSDNITIKLPATIKASITGNCSGSSGSCTGNAATATKLGTSSVGAVTNPIYLNAGVPTETGGTLAKKIQIGVGAGSFSDMLQTLQSDNNNYRSCTIRCENGNGYNAITLGAHNENDGGPSGIKVINTAGTVTATAPTPVTADDSTKIATTAFVKAQGYITSSGSITGNAATATKISTSPLSQSYVGAVSIDGALINSIATGFGAVWNAPTKNHRVACATRPNSDDRVFLCYSVTNSNITSNTNTVAKQLTWEADSGNLATSGTITATAPDAADNSAKVATTNWIRNILDYYPYKLDSITTVNNKNFGQWSYVNIREDTTGGFDSLVEPGHYHVNASQNTKGSPFSDSGADGILIVDNASSAAYVSTVKRCIQRYYTLGATGTYRDVFIRGGYVDSNGWHFGNWSSLAFTDKAVMLSGDQTIAGSKTFTSDVLGYDFAGRGGSSGYCALCGQQEDDLGAYVIVYGKTRSNAPGYVRLYARTEGDAKVLECRPNGTLTWNGQSIQTSSDERLKTPISDINSDILDAWSEVQWGEFKFLEAVEEKGENARYHIGLIAQSVDRVFKNHGSDILKYGILCHDESEATEDEPAKDLWMVRYTEALCMEAAYQRHKNKILEDRISELEKRLAKLKGTM